MLLRKIKHSCDRTHGLILFQLLGSIFDFFVHYDKYWVHHYHLHHHVAGGQDGCLEITSLILSSCRENQT